MLPLTPYNFPESIVSSLEKLFPHSSFPIPLNMKPSNLQPKTSQSPKPKQTQLETQSQPKTKSELEIQVPPKLKPPAEPRTTSFAPSSPKSDLIGGNLIPRSRRSIRDDSEAIRRTHQISETSRAGAKIVCRTSGRDEFNYMMMLKKIYV